jgi:hypothetical protein
MVDNTDGLAQLELIRQRELSEQETDILHAFGLAMRPGVPDAAAEAASRLDALCPPLEGDQEAGDYIWRVWGVMFDIAASTDATDQMHSALLAVLQALEKKSRGQLDCNEVRARSVSQVVPTMLLVLTIANSTLHSVCGRVCLRLLLPLRFITAVSCILSYMILKHV